MKALVTGANGFVGSHVVEQLLATGRYEVQALVRPGSATKNLDGIECEIVRGTIDTRENADKALATADIVFHVAGVVREREKGEYLRVNRDATRFVGEAAAERKGGPATVVLVSSQAAVGPNLVPDQPRTEGDEPTPVTGYGRSKLAGELELRKLAGRLPASIARPPTVYGPRDADYYDAFKLAQGGLVPKPGFGQKTYCMIHALDLARALIHIAEKGRRLAHEDPASGVYFVTDGGTYPFEELVKRTGASLDRKPLVVPLPVQATWVVALFSELGAKVSGKPALINFDKVREFTTNAWTCSNEALRRDTGWSPSLPLDEGLKQTARWYQERGMLRTIPAR